MHRCTHDLIAIMICVVAFQSSAQADGLIYQLPADGAWIEYDIDQRAFDSKGATESQRTGTIKVSSVGSEVVDREPCRWIEIKRTYKPPIMADQKPVQVDKQPDEPDFIELYKVLVPEMQAVRGEKPIGHLVRSWYKLEFGLITPDKIEIIENRMTYTAARKGENGISDIPDAK
jgi:hypothetical protein